MNILMLTHEFPPYPGGVGRYCSSLANAAVRAGHTLTVLAPYHDSFSPDTDDSFVLKRFPGNVFHFREMTTFRARIQDLLKQSGQKFDAIHAADWPALIALRTIHTPESQRIATLHGTDILLLKRSIRARLARASVALSSFDKLVCNSAYTQSLLQQNFSRLLPRSCVTPLGVDKDWFETASMTDQTAFLERISSKPDDLIVLTVARLDSRKGQLNTIDALAQLPASIKSRAHYVCVGKEIDAGYSDTLTAQAKEDNVRITLTGRLPDGELKAAYTLAHVFSLTGESIPNKVEGFGLVLLEAAAQGLPSVVTQLQALPEVVVDGKTGWVCNGRSELVTAFETALTQSDQNTLATNCIAHARRYTWDQCAELTYGKATEQGLYAA